jgi:hypothetical protein
VLASRRRSSRLPAEMDLYLCYLFWAAILIWVTVGKGKLLTFDYKASILLPGAFLMLALTLLRAPEGVAGWRHYATVVAAGVACAAPLARVDLYTVLDIQWLQALLLVVLLLLAAVRFWKGMTAAGWSLAMAAFAALSFGMIPKSTGTPWYSQYQGPEMSRAVARAQAIVLRRTPADTFPLFWYQDRTDRWSAEFRGVTCSMLTIVESMKDFPRVNEKLPPGTRLFLLREQGNAIPAAQYALARAGVRAAVRSQDRVAYGDETFSITQFEILPPSAAARREGFAVDRERPLRTGDLIAAPGPAHPCRSVLREPVTVAKAGVYQFELRQPGGATSRFGALASSDAADWLEEAGAPVQEAGARIDWFRLAVAPDEPVYLAVDADAAGDACPSPPRDATLSMLRSREPIPVQAFLANLGRPPKANLIPNGAFEIGLLHWSGMRGKIRQSTDCYAGACVEFVPVGQIQQYLVQWGATRLKRGARYRFTAWIRSSDAKPIRIEFGMWDAARSVWLGRRDVTAAMQWGQVSTEFVNDTAEDLAPLFWESRGDYGRMLVDEVELKELAPPPK